MVAGLSPMHFFRHFLLPYGLSIPTDVYMQIHHSLDASKSLDFDGLVDTCDSSSSFCSLSCHTSVYGTFRKRPSTKSWDRCGHGICSNGWVKLLILESHKPTCETTVCFCGVSAWSMAFVCAGLRSAVVRTWWLHMAEWLRFLFH